MTWWRDLSNCFLWAAAMHRRRRGKAQRRYFLVRWSDAGWMPHFLYGEMRRGRVRVVSLKPAVAVARRGLLPPSPFFRGVVRWGD